MDQPISNVRNNNNQLVTPNSTPMILMDLIDDCLIEVFSFLNLQDLCTVSEVCKRFQQLGKVAFKSSWQKRVVNLHSFDYDTTTTDNLRILHHFGGMLEKLDVATNNRNLFNVVMEKCGSKLVELTIANVNNCGRVLNKVNIAKFKNLKSLRFGSDISDTIDPRCIDQKFVNLEHYAMLFVPGMYFRNFSAFIKLNPQLKRLGLAHDGVKLPLTRKVIYFIDQNLVQLEELELSLLDFVDEFSINDRRIVYQPLVFKNLKRLIFKHCWQTNYWLRYLCISNEKMEEMHFHVNHAEGWNDFITIICKEYKQLKKLKFNFFLDEEILMKLCELPRLSEIECYDSQSTWSINLTYRMVQCIPNFIRRSKTINRIVLRPFTGKIIFDETLDPKRWNVTLSVEKMIISKI